MNRRQAREHAFRLVFEYSFRQDEQTQEIYDLYSHENELENEPYIKKSFLCVIENLENIDNVIGKYSSKRKNERISKVASAILRLALGEILYNDEIAVNISVNEAVELAKKFDDENVPGFINGVLGSIIRDLK